MFSVEQIIDAVIAVILSRCIYCWHHSDMELMHPSCLWSPNEWLASFAVVLTLEGPEGF